MSSGELECLADSRSFHSILHHRQLFLDLVPTHSSITMMARTSNLVQKRGYDVTHAFYVPRRNITLLSFKDIKVNGYHAREVYVYL